MVGLTAQLYRHVLERIRGLCHDTLPHLRGTDKGDLLNVRMSRDSVAQKRAVAVDHVKGAGRHAGA